MFMWEKGRGNKCCLGPKSCVPCTRPVLRASVSEWYIRPQDGCHRTETQGGSEVNSNWLITSERANTHAQKAPFTCVVYNFKQEIRSFITAFLNLLLPSNLSLSLEVNKG